MPLPILRRRQKEVLALPAGGHTVILGTAGSGKTTLALYRAAFLANPITGHSGRTLLLIFNKTLVAYLRAHLDSDVPGLRDVRVETYHKFALGYLSSRGLRGRIICNESMRHRLIAMAIGDVAARRSHASLLGTPTDTVADSISWIAQNGLTTLDLYVAMESSGINPPNLVRHITPEIVYDIYTRYLQLRAEHGYPCDFDDLATLVKRYFESDSSTRMYRHIVIDEGQDFSPEMLRSLVVAVPRNGSLTFLGDMAQQIYGQRISWRTAGLDVGSVWYFQDNYRNTRNIARLALALAAMPYYSEIPDLVEPKYPTAEGPAPTLVQFSDPTQEVVSVADLATRSSTTRTSAILTRRHEDAQRFLRQLPRDTIRLSRELDSWLATPGVRVGTYHSAKGLEFDTVILPLLTDDDLPDPRVTAAVGLPEALTREGKLLYVAITRARTQLILTHAGPLTALLPEQPELYTRVTL